MSTIIKLPKDIINQIAAGEVVERPASIIKELVENSIDANATGIEINLTSDEEGIDLEVIDDGKGMTEEELKLAFESHTTSKIGSIKDLENIHTLGFRGEALASIASVSKVEISTKTKDSATGYKLNIDGGKFSNIVKVTGNNGTSIKIKDIFYNVPARKKFLKSYRTEVSHIYQILTQIALANPSIGFRITNNGKEVYNLYKNESLETRIKAISNINTEELITVHNESNIKISGFIVHPKQMTDRRKDQFVFVNKRPIQDRTVSKAIYEGYRGYIMQGKHPSFFIFIEIKPGEVDVNVHPRKSEVRFLNNNEVFTSVKNSITTSLAKYMQEKQVENLNIDNRSYKFREPSSNQNHRYGSFQKSISNQQVITFQKAPVSFNPRIKDKIDLDVTETIDNIFQIFNTYIVIEKSDEIMFIDQHAAAERITFEAIKSKRKNEIVSYLISQSIELKPEEKIVIIDNAEVLDNLGFQVEDSGGNSLLIKTVPEDIKNSNLEKLFSEIANEFMVQNRDIKKVKDINEHIIATLSCHTSIRAGMKLDMFRINKLIEDLMKCDNPYSCPHGRPIIWNLSKYELEKNFKRK
ncbi:DNA mismatch repair endonuclease MutL [Candidatus Dojkabacteria bacterium]|uniref:DNA mismatch repair protein MutL n=1 Tax=Candidatus Dojkabacteria bacterium TaxID=2099670 RepID=A0A955RI70_9BACT|nr:DNA mismatch repair endonuclease MutL [Candidatus Dojkabacteria bacterium]